MMVNWMREHKLTIKPEENIYMQKRLKEPRICISEYIIEMNGKINVFENNVHDNI